MRLCGDGFAVATLTVCGGQRDGEVVVCEQHDPCLRAAPTPAETPETRQGSQSGPVEFSSVFLACSACQGHSALSHRVEISSLREVPGVETEVPQCPPGMAWPLLQDQVTRASRLQGLGGLLAWRGTGPSSLFERNH